MIDREFKTSPVRFKLEEKAHKIITELHRTVETINLF